MSIFGDIILNFLCFFCKKKKNLHTETPAKASASAVIAIFCLCRKILTAASGNSPQPKSKHEYAIRKRKRKSHSHAKQLRTRTAHLHPNAPNADGAARKINPHAQNESPLLTNGEKLCIIFITILFLISQSPHGRKDIGYDTG